MPTMTTNTPLISNANLAARWNHFTNALFNPAKQDIAGELQQLAQEHSLDIGPVLGTFAQRLIDGRSPQPTTTTELLENFSLFITQGIAELEQKAVDFEQEFVRTFSNLMGLKPQSFRKGSLDMTNNTLDSSIRLADALGKERLELEAEAEELKAAFNDTDGRIILAQDRIHAISNALQVIKGYAALIRREVPEPNELREFLDAIKTNVLSVAEGNRATLAGNPLELYRRMNPRVEVKITGSTPVFLNERHPKYIVTALGHLIDNAFNAGATKVRIKAESQPSDPVFTIGIEDNARGGMPEGLPQKLMDGEAGSGWRILKKVTFKRLGAEVKIISPFQNDESGPYGTLVMLFIPVMAQTGDEPSTGRTRRADSGPIPAVNSITPPRGVPAIKTERPVSMAAGVDPSIAGGTACFSENAPGVLLKFDKLK